MADTIEPASSGRSKCRACQQFIGKGHLRFGEREASPFGEGEATFWFHLRCAALKRPERFAALYALPGEVEDAAQLRQWAEQGREHARIARINGAERAPSGRARCRQCRGFIEKGQWRIKLDVWEEGRFNPIGFVHITCSNAYFGTTKLGDRICQLSPSVSAAELADLVALLEKTSRQGSAAAD